VQSLVLGVTLFPLRAVITVVAVSWYAGMAQLGAWGHTDLSAPLAPWRRRFFVNIGQPFARLLLAVLGFWSIDQTGPPSVRPHPSRHSPIQPNPSQVKSSQVKLMQCKPIQSNPMQSINES